MKLKGRLTSWIVVLLIFLISFCIRIYKADTVPAGVFIDEASLGYNAYSILKTGKDEHGISFPLVFKAFGDQKLPAYIYAQIPFISIFGLNNLSVRMPSILAGSLLTVFIYFLGLKFGFRSSSALIGALITAVNPWSILISRFAFESNLALLFFTLGLYFYPIKKNPSIGISIISGLFFALTLYTYVAYKLVSFLILALFFLLSIRVSFKQNILILVSFFVFSAPLLPSFFSQQSRARLVQLQHNEAQGTIMKINEDRAFCDQALPKIICYLSANKPLSYLSSYISRYIEVFSPSYLFFTGDKETHQNVENYGSFFVILIPFYLLGLLSLFNKLIANTLNRQEKLILAGLLLAPIASILAGYPHKLRLTPFFPFILLVFVLGIERFSSLRWYKKVFTKVFMGLLLVNGIFFMIAFLSIQTDKFEYLYGSYIPKLSKYLNQQKKDTQVYVQSIPEFITYYAYFTSYNPHLFQKQAKWTKTDLIGFSHATDLENIHITQKDIYALSCEGKINNTHDLFVTNEYQQKNAFAIEQTIKSNNNVHSFAFVYNSDVINWNLCVR